MKTFETVRSVTKPFKAMSVFIGIVAVAAVSMVVVARPAMASDTYYPCQAMISTVSPGATAYAQSITCAPRPVCGEKWGQIYRVEWKMTVHAGGITVRSIKLTVTHTRGEDITIGYKVVLGANTSLDFGAWDQVPPAQQIWSKTYNPADTYLTKRSDNTIEFQFPVSSSKDNGCSVGWATLRYILKIV